MTIDTSFSQHLDRIARMVCETISDCDIWLRPGYLAMFTCQRVTPITTPRRTKVGTSQFGAFSIRFARVGSRSPLPQALDYWSGGCMTSRLQ